MMKVIIVIAAFAGICADVVHVGSEQPSCAGGADCYKKTQGMGLLQRGSEKGTSKLKEGMFETQEENVDRTLEESMDEGVDETQEESIDETQQESLGETSTARPYEMGCIPASYYHRNQCCPQGYQEITNLHDCASAWQSLQHTCLVGTRWGGTAVRNHRPSGCWLHKPNNHIHFNPRTVRHLIYNNDHVICKRR